MSCMSLRFTLRRLDFARFFIKTCSARTRRARDAASDAASDGFCRGQKHTPPRCVHSTNRCSRADVRRNNVEFQVPPAAPLPITYTYRA
jgi:hypothetical protein